MGVMRVLHPDHGDVAIEWDVTDQASVDAAIAEFERALTEDKKMAVQVRPGPEKIVKTLDPAAEEIILFSQLQGG